MEWPIRGSLFVPEKLGVSKPVFDSMRLLLFFNGGEYQDRALDPCHGYDGMRCSDHTGHPYTVNTAKR